MSSPHYGNIISEPKDPAKTLNEPFSSNPQKELKINQPRDNLLKVRQNM